MAAITVDELLKPVSEASPCGEDLSDRLWELEQLEKGKPDQQIGDTLVAAEEPDWVAVARLARELAARSRDLRVLLSFALALTRTEGYAGLQAGVALLRGTIERFWPCLYPQLDPEEGNDPTERLLKLRALSDPETFLRAVREAPLAHSRVLGRFSMRDVAIATGQLPAPKGQEAPKLEVVNAALRDTALEELQATALAIESAAADLKGLETALVERVGAGTGPDLGPLARLLGEARAVVGPALAARIGGAGGPAGEGIGPGPGAAPPVPQPTVGPVSSREDAVRVIDLVSEYFRRHEPSSPVPLLLDRAKRLVGKDFLAVIKDIAPAGVQQAEAVRGPPEGK
jgi:type VI secretion system protein ImpA